MRINHARFTSFLTLAWKQILDTLFPLSCLGCGSTETWICDRCLGQIPARLEQRCPTCLKHPTPFGQVCFGCRDTVTPSLDGLFVASSYRASFLPHAIHTFKYRFIPDLAIPLGSFLHQAIERTELPLPDVLIPVPLHSRRLRFRGFNQSELLAQELAKNLAPGLALPLQSDVLIRTRYTKPQMKTESRAERLANLKNAFVIAPGKEATVTGQDLWLIDDVATTGTTLEECARILKQHGARSVFGIVLAR